MRIIEEFKNIFPNAIPNDNFACYYISNEEEKFYEDKKYFVKITTSNKKFDLITKIFKIEVVDPDLYRM